jgi:hypothetical protein
MTEENPIIDEIRRTREQLLAKHNGDLDLLISDLQSKSKERSRADQPDGIPPERSQLGETAAKKGG